IFTFAIRKDFYKAVPSLNRFTATKDILVASTTFWIPSIITTVGSQLGTITVFLAAGSGNAGVYFISFSIVTGIMVIASVLSSIAYPTISALKDGKKRATWRLIKISLLLTIPISNILMFYPADILSLFGSDYATGASTLQILSLSSLPTCIATAIGVLFYSYGNNGKFLLLGLVTSIPRVILYFLFVPTLGGDGAALSYLIGSVAGAIISLLYAQKINMRVSYRQIVTLFMVPVIIAIPLEFVDFNSVVSIFIILILSYLVFIILKLVDSQDIGDLM
ncbi:MAG TPA: polysaccharide biosynthesis C-terminal domain-containing protein, partial [Candidatus Saccharimonadales bacterium]|nr:polysaccharide biosynthesis C-terminal domain-containing protein [Candidatus Saccharimonadales bacterium]